LTNTKTDNLFFLYLGKLIIVKKILLVLTLTALIFACKKEDDKPNTNTTSTNTVEGCTDTIAINFLATATIDDGSCEYPPSALKLSIITVNSMPMTNNGSDWDIGILGSENPDVFYVLKEGDGDIVSSSSKDNIATFPILFTENLPYTINTLSKEYTIEIYDNDEILGVGENEFIGSCSFTPNELITTLSINDELNIINNGVDMTLDIEWLQ
jgi:hypothetical protein|tara:strand:- start:117 stop:752 length:636 start_codon:yes stop_codon:yes gene_type:complete